MNVILELKIYCDNAKEINCKNFAYLISILRLIRYFKKINPKKDPNRQDIMNNEICLKELKLFDVFLKVNFVCKK